MDPVTDNARNFFKMQNKVMQTDTPTLLGNEFAFVLTSKHYTWFSSDWCSCRVNQHCNAPGRGQHTRPKPHSHSIRPKSLRAHPAEATRPKPPYAFHPNDEAAAHLESSKHTLSKVVSLFRVIQGRRRLDRMSAIVDHSRKGTLRSATHLG